MAVGKQRFSYSVGRELIISHIQGQLPISKNNLGECSTLFKNIITDKLNSPSYRNSRQRMATEKKTISQRNDLFSYYDRLQMLLIIKRRIPIEITGRIIECPPQLKRFNGTIKKKGFTLARRRMAIDAKKQSALTILKEKLPE